MEENKTDSCIVIRKGLVREVNVSRFNKPRTSLLIRRMHIYESAEFKFKLMQGVKNIETFKSKNKKEFSRLYDYCKEFLANYDDLNLVVQSTYFS